MPKKPDTDILPESCDVAIVGGGPAGLAAATKLKELGVESVHILERESDAGGIPRHCGHPPFGMREFKKCLTGPAYAASLVKRAQKAGVKINLNTSVARLSAGGLLQLSTPDGLSELQAKAVILCTGVRETPRAPRFVSGARPLGVLTTGALQSMIYLKGRAPCKNPVIIGTELVSFSALLTCRHAKIKPMAMIEENSRITARWFNGALPMMLGVPMHLNTKITEILGKNRVTGIKVSDKTGQEREISCDGVIFTGGFTPEASLLRMGHLEVDPASGGPFVDQYGRCSDPAYFATGNLLRPVETAGWSWQEGHDCASYVVRYLKGNLPAAETKVRIIMESPVIKYTVPQVISLPYQNDGISHIQLRVSCHIKGGLSAENNYKILWSKNISAQPERRILIPLEKTAALVNSGDLKIKFRSH